MLSEKIQLRMFSWLCQTG